MRAQQVIGQDGRVRVLIRRCDSCIFRTEGSAVSPARRDEVVAANLKAEALLTCHHTLPGNADGLDPAVCAGYWARYSRDVITGRLARMIGITRIWPERTHL